MVLGNQVKTFLAYLLYYLGDFVSRFLTITKGRLYPLYSKLMLWSNDLDTKNKIWKK
jgi:hypothetical protein